MVLASCLYLGWFRSTTHVHLNMPNWLFVPQNGADGWPSGAKDPTKSDEKLRLMVFICRKEAIDEVWLYDVVCMIRYDMWLFGTVAPFMHLYDLIKYAKWKPAKYELLQIRCVRFWVFFIIWGNWFWRLTCWCWNDSVMSKPVLSCLLWWRTAYHLDEPWYCNLITWLFWWFVSVVCLKARKSEMSDWNCSTHQCSSSFGARRRTWDSCQNASASFFTM